MVHPLHTQDGARKIRKGGMPIYNKKNQKLEYGDLYIRFNIILPENFEGDESLTCSRETISRTTNQQRFFISKKILNLKVKYAKFYLKK